jgi:hypothetical protein
MQRLHRFLLRRIGFGDNSGSAEASDGAREITAAGESEDLAGDIVGERVEVNRRVELRRRPAAREVDVRDRKPMLGLPRRWRRSVVVRNASEKFRRFVRPSAASCDHDVR